MYAHVIVCSEMKIYKHIVEIPQPRKPSEDRYALRVVALPHTPQKESLAATAQALCRRGHHVANTLCRKNTRTDYGGRKYASA